MMRAANQPGTIAEPGTGYITSPFGGRRRGDAILIAVHHAIEQGDADVAAQLLVEYQQTTIGSALVLTIERRREGTSAVLRRFWQQFRAKFSS